MNVVLCACEDMGAYYAPTSRKICRRCGIELQVLLDTEENRERLHRGIELDEWFAAPATPAKRAFCVLGERPCPFLRCKYHLGRPGGMGCTLDETANEPTAPLAGEKVHHSLDYIGAKLDCVRENVRMIESGALLKLRLEHADELGGEEVRSDRREQIRELVTIRKRAS